jgi:hypothetical protein
LSLVGIDYLVLGTFVDRIPEPFGKEETGAAAVGDKQTVLGALLKLADRQKLEKLEICGAFREFGV